MLTLKEYNTKLSRLKSTRKLTRTMRMISANKLHKAQDAQKRAVEYAKPLERMAGVVSDSELARHPLSEVRGRVKQVVILVITSDRGLCGAFNNNLNRQVAQWIGTQSGGHEHIRLSFCGKRGLVYFKNRGNVLKHYEGIMARANFTATVKVSKELQEMFLAGKCDEVHIAYNVFKNVMQRTPVIEKLLPLNISAGTEGHGAKKAAPILEPDQAELWSSMVPQLVDLRLYTALLNSMLSEHSARMISMESATNNTEKLIDRYTILRNQARQAAITSELSEIVAGAEALK